MNSIELRKFKEEDLSAAAELWNSVIEAGDCFPGDKILSHDEITAMFAEQTEVVCAFIASELVGLYILHPNGIGRLAHIANASYAVKDLHRGKGIGKTLVADSIAKAKEKGFRGLQFNAVTAHNYGAIALYLKLGFKIIGTIAGGYRLARDKYQDTIIFLKTW